MTPGGTTPKPQSARADASHDLRRVLGLWDATCVVIGAIVGVGIFFTPRDVARVAGSTPAAMLAWVVGGVVALLGAFTFAELGRLRPFAGGQYHILRDAYGSFTSFLSMSGATMDQVVTEMEREFSFIGPLLHFL